MRTSHQPGIISGRWRLWEQTEGVLCLSETSFFTDVWGAKRAGIPNILVKPIHPKEEIQIVLKRYLEKIVLHFYKKSQRHEKKVEK